MTIDYKELIERIQQAIDAQPLTVPEVAMMDKADLRTVLTMLNGMVDAKPVASAMFVADHMPRVQWSEAGLELLGKVNLYTHPVPQPQPERQPVSEPTEPYRQAIMGAVARAWCHPLHSHKEMDASLAETITNEVLAINRSEPTEAQVEAVARLMAARSADNSGMTFDGYWKLYANKFRLEARYILRAALAAKGEK